MPSPDSSLKPGCCFLCRSASLFLPAIGRHVAAEFPFKVRPDHLVRNYELRIPLRRDARDSDDRTSFVSNRIESQQ